MPVAASLKEKGTKVLSLLKKAYPNSRCTLNFRNPYELLVATILAAQCTDERVNQVTGRLFKKYPTPAALAKANPSELEEEIRSTGFYKNKVRSLLGCSQQIVAEFGGEVSDRLEDLTRLRGVGRKTANVVLGNAFGKPAVVIETHVLRLANRIGLSKSDDPVKMEFEFMELFPKSDWTRLAHLLIDHGRAVCKAPKPKCDICPLTSVCDYFKQTQPSAQK